MHDLYDSIYHVLYISICNALFKNNIYTTNLQTWIYISSCTTKVIYGFQILLVNDTLHKNYNVYDYCKFLEKRYTMNEYENNFPDFYFQNRFLYQFIASSFLTSQKMHCINFTVKQKQSLFLDKKVIVILSWLMCASRFD